MEGYTQYVTEPTNDKIFLLGEEARNRYYGFTEILTKDSSNCVRHRKATDFAKQNGTYVCKNNEEDANAVGCSYWLTRMPYNSENTMYAITVKGSFDWGYVYEDVAGVLPALCID